MGKKPGRVKKISMSKNMKSAVLNSGGQEDRDPLPDHQRAIRSHKSFASVNISNYTVRPISTLQSFMTS